MKKYEDAVKGMFDDIELPAYNELTNDSATPVENKQGSGNKIPPEDFKYLEKTLQIQRNFTAINQKYDELLKKCISIENKLDGYKDMQGTGPVSCFPFLAGFFFFFLLFFLFQAVKCVFQVLKRVFHGLKYVSHALK